MASIIKVDQIENLNGDICFVDGYPQRPGTVVEYLINQCDGTSATVKSNTYTFANVTTANVSSTTYFDVPGSIISYQPPPNVSRVVYSFQFNSYSVTVHDINHFRFYIDSDEIIFARHNRAGQYNEQRYSFTWPIVITDFNDFNTGKVNGWTSPKTLKLTYRRYGNSNYSDLFGTRYWDGTTGNQFNQPTLSIIAIV
jgi:hypothetical protein